MEDYEIKKALDEANWEVLGKQLVAYAILIGRKYIWNTGGIDLLGEGNTPEDIVQRVILKAYSRERNWNPEKIELKKWLIGQIKSEINNLYKKSGHEKEQSVTLPSSSEGDIEDSWDKIEYSSVDDGVFPHAKSLTPEQVLEQKQYALERKQYAEEMLSMAIEAIDGDPELEQIFDAIKQVGMKPQDLADELNLPVKDVYNRLKRFRRRMKAKFKNG